jgi:hypothetical protein
MGSRVRSQFRDHEIASPDVACEFFLGKRIRLGFLGEELHMAEFVKQRERKSERGQVERHLILRIGETVAVSLRPWDVGRPGNPAR